MPRRGDGSMIFAMWHRSPASRPAARPGLTVVAAIVLAAACSGAGGEVPATQASVALEIDWRAREAVPGEAVRVRVVAPVALERLRGRFLDGEFFLSPDREGGGRRWSGWTMIALDQEPITGSIDVSGVTVDGRPAQATVAVTVAPKEFPEERLTVSSAYVEPPADVQRRLARERAELAAIYELRSDDLTVGEPFLRPVPGVPTSKFGTRRFFNDQPRSPHPGLDLRAATGTPVVASGAGRVVLAQDLYYSGNTVIVDHGGGLFTLYAHLSEIGVEAGATVARGETVGLSGATGRVTGPHLHWGAKIGDRPFDPRSLLEPSLFD